MQAALFYLLVLAAFLSFSFASWRRLREDYSTDEVFIATILFLFGGVSGWLLFDKWLPSFSFWGFLAGSAIFGFLAVKKINLKLFEALDGAIVGLLWFLLFFYLALGVRYGRAPELIDLALVLASALTLVVAYLYFRKYRQFSWYPSGKIGFIGSASASLYFFIRMIVAFGQAWMVLSQSRLIDGLFSLFLSIFFAGIVYLRSGRNFWKKK